MGSARTLLRREARRRDFLEAAARLFASRGFHEVTVEEVAEEVGLSKGTVYLYFESKDDLFHSIIVDKTRTLLGRLTAAIDCPRPFVECLVDVVRTHCLFYRENAAYFRIAHTEMARMNPQSHLRLHAHVEEMLRAHLAILTELVKKGQREGALRQGDPIALVKALGGILTSYVFHALLAQDQTPLAEQVAQIVDLYLHGTASSGREDRVGARMEPAGSPTAGGLPRGGRIRALEAWEDEGVTDAHGVD